MDTGVDGNIESQALAICEAALRPASYYLPNDYASRERFDAVIRGLNFKASPGYPYSQEKPTIGEWLGFNGIWFDDYQVERLWYDVTLIFSGSSELMLKSFVKSEPHKKTKADAGRWRVIMCFPLNYQVVWKMLFDYGNERLVESAYDIPVQHGITLVGGDWKLFYRQWKSLGFNAGSDVSAFDWCVTLRKMRLVYELRRRLAKGPHVSAWFSLASRLLDEAYSGVKVLFPNGEVWRINVPAVQKSGSPNTISDNGILRLLESVIISLTNGLQVYPLPRTVGDDGLERVPSDEGYLDYLQSCYLRRGWILKQLVPGMEFVGHLFTDQGPLPLYVAKHLCKFVHLSPEIIPEFLESMARLYAHSPHFWIWESLAAKYNLCLLSQDYYKAWYDFEALKGSLW